MANDQANDKTFLGLPAEIQEMIFDSVFEGKKQMLKPSARHPILSISKEWYGRALRSYWKTTIFEVDLKKDVEGQESSMVEQLPEGVKGLIQKLTVRDDGEGGILGLGGLLAQFPNLRSLHLINIHAWDVEPDKDSAIWQWRKDWPELNYCFTPFYQEKAWIRSILQHPKLEHISIDPAAQQKNYFADDYPSRMAKYRVCHLESYLIFHLTAQRLHPAEGVNYYNTPSRIQTFIKDFSHLKNRKVTIYCSEDEDPNWNMFMRVCLRLCRHIWHQDSNKIWLSEMLKFQREGNETKVREMNENKPASTMLWDKVATLGYDLSMELWEERRKEYLAKMKLKRKFQRLRKLSVEYVKREEPEPFVLWEKSKAELRAERERERRTKRKLMRLRRLRGVYIKGEKAQPLVLWDDEQAWEENERLQKRLEMKFRRLRRLRSEYVKGEKVEPVALW